MAYQQVIVVAGAPIEDISWLEASLKQYEWPYIIGVDRGALILSELGYSLNEAVGDFDSVTLKELETIKAHSQHITQLPSEKDLTDLDEALVHIKGNSLLDSLPVYLYAALGSTGGRLDHLLHNISLFQREIFHPLLSRVQLIEPFQEVVVFKPGSHWIHYDPRWKYFGVFTLNDVQDITIQKAKYTLPSTNTHGFISWISNEFIKNQDVLIEFKSGVVFVVLTALS